MRKRSVSAAELKRRDGKRNRRRSLQRRLEACGDRIEDKIAGVADLAIGAVEHNLDRWADAAIDGLLRRAGLAAPERLLFQENGVTIELVRQPDGSYAKP